MTALTMVADAKAKLREVFTAADEDFDRAAYIAVGRALREAEAQYAAEVNRAHADATKHHEGREYVAIDFDIEPGPVGGYCPDCMHWHVEVVELGGVLQLRHWHVIDCKTAAYAVFGAPEPPGDG